MTVEFLDDAADELTDAAMWYESKESGLGVRFRDDISNIVSRIAEDPMLWREREGGSRRTWASKTRIIMLNSRITRPHIVRKGFGLFEHIRRVRLPHLSYTD